MATSIYDNAIKEQKIIEHALKNGCHVAMQLVTETAVMFTVHENDLNTMQEFCKKEFGSCDVVEEIGKFLMCKVKT